MIVAQQLYEGIELSPGEPEGLITYMRTDSTRISKEAAMEALTLVREKFGDEYALQKPRFFKNRKKAQDAHEAIRPTSVFNTPEKIKPFLSKDQFALYELIWKRFVASQMKQAIMNKISISIAAGPYLFSASGSSVAFPGFMTLYMTTDDQIESESQKKKDDFPELSEGGVLKLNELEPKQHFTMPPPRFSEASLVKELEENGIGRPSTYAAILSTIREKGYVDLIKGYFKPNELGFIVNDLLVKSFPDVFDVEFTANMENDLDRIEAAEVNYSEILRQFYDAFEKELEAASTGMLSVKGIGFPTDLTCPQCQHRLHIRMGRNGQFLGCSNYPECTYTRNYLRDEKGVVHAIEPSSDQLSDKICDKCGKPMLIKDGRYGTFFACSGYPDCKTTLSTNSNGSGEKTGVDCPEQDCGGELIQRSSKRGKIFYGCTRFPDCTFATWDKPVPKECPECGAKFLVEKTTKKQGTFLTCNTKGCEFKATSE
jgi:DNA topoisomerase-1